MERLSVLLEQSQERGVSQSLKPAPQPWSRWDEAEGLRRKRRRVQLGSVLPGGEFSSGRSQEKGSSGRGLRGGVWSRDRTERDQVCGRKTGERENLLK